MKYKVYAALSEEATEGWVWFAEPAFEPYRLVLLINDDAKRRVYCECRLLDRNFIEIYNARPHTRKIDLAATRDVLVIGDWYRTALGIRSTGTHANLTILQRRNPFWQALRAGSQHPDPTVGLANRLGVLGLWLGLSGFAIPIVEHHAPNHVSVAEWIVGLCGLIALWACRGVRR
jgi:hypothetical protein